MDYDYFSKHYNLIAIDLSKQVELENLDLKQRINLLVNLKELEKQKKQLLIFHKILKVSFKMETQKTINFLNDSNNEESQFAAKKWYVIDSQTAKDKYNKIYSI